MSTPNPSPGPAPKDPSDPTGKGQSDPKLLNPSSKGSGSPYVWSDEEIGIGPFNLGFGTRVLKDISVAIIATILIILGIILIAKPDLQRILKNTLPDGDVPIPIPV